MRIQERFGTCELSAHHDDGADKAAFGREAKKFLNAVGKVLAAAGYECIHKPKHNKGGIAVSGEVTAVWFHPDRNAGIYVDVSQGPNLPGGAPNGLCIMYRATDRKDVWRGFANCWAVWNIDHADLAAKMLAEAERNEGRARR